MNLRRLLQSLLDHKVQFLVIGAWALPAYGYKRYTGDIDIFINATRTNAQHTMQALLAIGYEVVRDTTLEMFLSKKVLIRQYALETDIHPFVKGLEFLNAWKHKMKIEIEGVKVYVPSLDDMIKMKKAAGRDKDKLDLKELRKIQRYEKKNKK
ncbi:MAG: nucleotidyltransferase [Ignavibacteria bacterium]|nr:nucleotidyltransferase [Ignavibacteria bacterium]MBI3766736.1 nucleotidyltransferase [Ignavibacteriales bacterium]